MTKTIDFRQCRLRKTNSPSSSTVMVSYIPAKFARVQSVLRLKQEDGTWIGGWVVEHAGAKINEAHLPNAHQGIKAHRKATGDTTPRIVKTG